MSAAIAVVLFAGVLVLLFGPARGARNDVAAIRANVSSARVGIYKTLDTQQSALQRLNKQLHTLRLSLRVQAASLHTARRTSDDVSRVVKEARTTEITAVAILRHAEVTVNQLELSRRIQRELLTVARQTLQQTRQINRKIP
jgi:hypothetical protein